MLNKFVCSVTFLAGVILSGWIINFYAIRHYIYIDTMWSNSYENEKYEYAEKFANDINPIYNWAKVFYLGHSAVTDSIHLEGHARQTILSEALKRMEAAKFPFPMGADWRDFIRLKASISALLGDDTKANKYATEGCNLKRAMTIEECVIGKYGFANPADEPFGNRLSAISLYEDTALYNAIGTGDKTQCIFYQAVALKYFDLDKARAILNQLAREGRLTPEMHKIYCNPRSPTDTVVCKEQ